MRLLPPLVRRRVIQLRKRANLLRVGGATAGAGAAATGTGVGACCLLRVNKRLYHGCTGAGVVVAGTGAASVSPKS